MILPGSQFPIMGRPLVFEDVQSLPAMTSNTTPTGHIASASSESGGTTNLAYLAFNQVLGTDRWASLSNGAPQWLMRETPVAIKVWKYLLRSGNTASATGPTVFSLQGSNDGTTFTTVDSRTGQTWADFETKSFEIAAPYRPYRYHRLLISTIAGGNVARVSELELLQVF